MAAGVYVSGCASHLHDGPYDVALRGLLHRLVAVAAGVDVREDAHRSAPGHLGGRLHFHLGGQERVRRGSGGSQEG
eukprot:1177986-Prorocentrum_minimum.AAC.1